MNTSRREVILNFSHFDDNNSFEFINEDWCFKQERIIQAKEKNHSKAQTDVAQFFQQFVDSELGFTQRNRGRESCYFSVAESNHSKGCLKSLNFPAKKLREKIRVPLTLYQFIYSVSNIYSTVVNFPAKRFGKNTVLKNTHAPFFFLKFNMLVVWTVKWSVSSIIVFNIHWINHKFWYSMSSLFILNSLLINEVFFN